MVSRNNTEGSSRETEVLSYGDLRRHSPASTRTLRSCSVAASNTSEGASLLTLYLVTRPSILWCENQDDCRFVFAPYVDCRYLPRPPSPSGRQASASASPVLAQLELSHIATEAVAQNRAGGAEFESRQGTHVRNEIFHHDLSAGVG